MPHKFSINHLRRYYSSIILLLVVIILLYFNNNYKEVSSSYEVGQGRYMQSIFSNISRETIIWTPIELSLDSTNPKVALCRLDFIKHSEAPYETV